MHGLRAEQLLRVSGAEVVNSEVVDEFDVVTLQVITATIEREHQQVDMYESTPAQVP